MGQNQKTIERHKKKIEKQKQIKKQRQQKKWKKNEKKIAILLILIVVVVCLLGIGFLVFRDYQKKQSELQQQKEKQQQIEQSVKETDKNHVNINPLLEYLDGIDTELLNEEIAPDPVEATGAGVNPASGNAAE